MRHDSRIHTDGVEPTNNHAERGIHIARAPFAAWQGYQADADGARLQAQIAPLEDKLRVVLEHAARKSTRTKYLDLLEPPWVAVDPPSVCLECCHCRRENCAQRVQIGTKQIALPTERFE